MPVEDRPAAERPDLARIRAYYDQTWPDYRLLWLNPENYAIHFGYWDGSTEDHADSLINMNRVLARHLGIPPAGRILDAGCGVGGSALWLARTYGAEVVGITPVASQVARARRYAAEQGLADRLTFEQQDYTRTTFPDASFDVVWAIESVCHAPDKRLFFQEARRLLRRGGRLGIVEYFRHRRPMAPQDEALLHSWLSGWAIPDLATSEELERWAEGAGFRDVRSDSIAEQVEPSLRRLYRMARAAWPLGLALRPLGLRTRTQHGNLRGAKDQYRAFRRGLWFEAILTARV